jgi:sporulation protein YlmC with PRC-barrel domain
MDQARQVIGATAYTRDGDRIGRIGQLYLDDATEQPEWITVSTGLFGTKESFVPLADAHAEGNRVTVPYPKEQVKGAPRVEAGQGHLSPAEEAELYRYYGLPETGPFGDAAGTEPAAAGFAAGTSGTLDDPTAGPDVDTGRHRLRRYSAGEGDEPVP